MSDGHAPPHPKGCGCGLHSGLLIIPKGVAARGEYVSPQERTEFLAELFEAMMPADVEDWQARAAVPPPCVRVVGEDEERQ